MDESREYDVSGTWQGFYEQGGGRHGIRMTVAQKGASFVGRMRDEDTLLSSTEAIAVVNDAVDEVTVQAEVLGVLPESSIVEGTVTGRRVVFDKRYEGTHALSTWVEGVGEAHIEIPEHCVRYEGVLDQGGRRLRGEWRIRDDGAGAFELVRV